jgi:hypothetical protein
MIEEISERKPLPVRVRVLDRNPPATRAVDMAEVTEEFPFLAIKMWPYYDR